MQPAYRRILLKLSGEALAGDAGFGLDENVLRQIAADIAEVSRAGVGIGIVVGGGNYYRGATGSSAIARTAGDSIGMLATMMNSLAVAEYLREAGVAAKVYSAVAMDKVADLFSAEEATKVCSEGTAVIIGGGTGNPFFTTDTAAALRAAEIGAEVIVKATKVDGIYDSDPVKNPAAVKFDTLTFSEALKRNLKIMDATALSFCLDQNIPVIVFKLMERGNLKRCIVEGLPVGTTVTAKEKL